LVDANNFVDARTRLETSLNEHIAKFPDADTRLDFNYGEKIMMNHALRHVIAVIDKNDPEFNDNGVTKHHSDIVKDALMRVPKSDYTDTD
jgi:hypothetical protein